jgi:carbon monoxide dehydrogenase subunit G
MEFTNGFQVQAPIEEVWKLLLDLERIAPCMPGAQVIEQTADDAYAIAVKVKIGPMTMNYKGDVEIVEKDAATHTATMRAKAKEARGQGTASADIVMSLTEEPGGTQASIVTNMKISGKAAAMGQGVIKDVAGALTDTFAKNLAGLVTPGDAPSDAVAEEAPQAGATPPDGGEGPPSGEPEPAASAPPAPAVPPAPAAARAAAPEQLMFTRRVHDMVRQMMRRDRRSRRELRELADFVGIG